MKITIRFSKSEELKALPILLRHSSGMVLPDRVYVLEDSAVAALRDAGIHFEEIAADRAIPNVVGAQSGERI
ncbi:MAG TPA: hypothetical protein VGI40_14745 [Pirellulaceae bacterium]|jgi:hypothetical protein